MRFVRITRGNIPISKWYEVGANEFKDTLQKVIDQNGVELEYKNIDNNGRDTEVIRDTFKRKRAEKFYYSTDGKIFRDK